MYIIYSVCTFFKILEHNNQLFTKIKWCTSFTALLFFVKKNVFNKYFKKLKREKFEF